MVFHFFILQIYFKSYYINYILYILVLHPKLYLYLDSLSAIVKWLLQESEKSICNIHLFLHTKSDDFIFD